MDFKKIKKIYIIGIEGAGTSALARILKFKGFTVSGSDEGDHFYNSVLKSEDIAVKHRFNEKNIPSDVDVIIYGSSFKSETNKELKAALKLKKPIFTYGEMLARLFNKDYGIAICGTHGKSTTAAMLGYVFKVLELSPNLIVGAKIPQLNGNSIAGKSEYFIIEADEFQNKLKLYDPKMAILTSVDWDHPDTFPTFSEYKKAFIDFVAKIPKTGFLVVWGDSVATNEVARVCQGQIIKYGFRPDNDLVISKIGNQKAGVKFLKNNLGEFETKLTGDHNLLNIGAVVAVCYKLNLDMEKVREAIANFQGITRRFEYVGKRNGAILIDDYGHHPEEIKATLKGARQIYPDKNIIAVFHPHSYSRTEALLHEFAQSFDDANQVLVLDIYGSARENSGTVCSKDLVNLINKYNRDKAEYIPTIDEVIRQLKDKINKKDILISLGAGDVWKATNRLKIDE